MSTQIKTDAELSALARRLENLTPVEMIYELQRLTTEELCILHEFCSARIKDSVQRELRSGE